MPTKTNLKFINHASVLIENGDISLLTDPWYEGSAFHKGWRLQHELQNDQVVEILNCVTHIWISHEHPDHFSIGFFKKHSAQLKDQNIQILFQETSDKRVEAFLINSGFNVRIISFNKWVKISDDFDVLIFKDGFYDSGLVVNTNDTRILNLNDCEIRTEKRCNDILKVSGHCDVLLSQFSYAAWKGGRENLAWRKLAAREKLETLKLQSCIFKPKVIVPFASYVYFSNAMNYYLNDSANKPEDIVNYFSNSDSLIKIMKPFDEFFCDDISIKNDESLNFWLEARNKIDGVVKDKFNVVTYEDLCEYFSVYKSRIFKKNSNRFIKILRYLSPVSVFQPVVISLADLNIIVVVDILGDLKITDDLPDISMSSESLAFIFNNTFGFDTLTVNGCFEEEASSGFSKMTKIFAIENLNNLGFYVKPSIIFNYKIIVLFFSRLYALTKKINLDRT